MYGVLLDDYLTSDPDFDLSTQLGVFNFFLRFWKSLREDYQFVNDTSSENESPFAYLDADFLVASPTGLFRVTSRMSVIPFQRYCAVGAGEDFALGALHATYESERNAEQLATLGVEAAIAFNDSCGGPIDTFSFAADS